MAITYKQLTTKHTSYNSDYWDELETLANGGSALNRAMLMKLLPKSPGEEEEIYEWRINNAYFTPYLGAMLGYYSSALISDPLVMNTDDANAKMPDFYERFEDSVYRKGSHSVSANEHVRLQLSQAFLTKTSYTLVDFPEVGDEPPKTKLEEEILGTNEAYLCPIDARDVFNFREDDEGNLIWINIHSKISFQEDISDDGLTNVETFTIYYADHWDRYVYKWKDKEKPPQAKTPPTEMKSGTHSFGSVPVVRLQLPDALYFGDKIGSIAKKIFQKMCALDYSSDRSLLQFLVVNLSAPSAESPDPIAEDQYRAVNQTVGPGRVMVLAEKDKAQYVGGDSAPFDWTQQHIVFLREEMQRIIGQSALSLAHNGKALARSVESKAFDRKSMEIILEHLGLICRNYMTELFQLVASGRGEGDLLFRASGMADYSQVGIDEIAEIQSKVNSLNLPSPMFKSDMAFKTVQNLLDGHPQERLDQIKHELDSGYASASKEKETEE